MGLDRSFPVLTVVEELYGFSADESRDLWVKIDLDIGHKLDEDQIVALKWGKSLTGPVNAPLILQKSFLKNHTLKRYK